MHTLIPFLLSSCLFIGACSQPRLSTEQDQSQLEQSQPAGTPSFWKDATVYFIMLDRFKNADPTNDKAYERTQTSAFQRGIHGGDLKGVIEQLDAGYFDALGVDAIWLTPVIEQIHGQDLGWGATYAYHGYWPKDWTNVDKAFGREADLKELIEKAHQRNIKVLLDVIVNHTGPVTSRDPKWPDNWVRMRPVCQWQDYQSNVSCGLNENLPDIKTDESQDVPLPEALLAKWQNEGRLNQEQQELDAFFKRTGLSKAPKHYIVKWLTDWVKEYGVDGFRVDTAKHVEADIWQVLKDEAQYSLQQWRNNNPEQVTHHMPFYMVGEVMHFGVNGFKNTPVGTRLYDYGDKQVDFYEYGMDSLINMGFPHHAQMDYEALFSLYSDELNQGPLQGVGILNYVISHDDPEPYDPQRAHPLETANKLMLSPGSVQIYYGDELSRPIDFTDKSDARLRLPIDWDVLAQTDTQAILAHWQKLGQFRKHHPAVGSGVHKMLSNSPYLFSRTLNTEDKVLVGLDLVSGLKKIDVQGLWPDATHLHDYYSGQQVTVEDGHVNLNSTNSVVLLGQPH